MEKITFLINSEGYFYTHQRVFGSDEYYRKSEVDAMNLKLAICIGSPKDADRIHECLPLVLSSYRRRCDKAEKKLDNMLAAVKALVEAGNEMVNPTDRVTDNILEMYGKIKERTENLRKAIAAVERLEG